MTAANGSPARLGFTEALNPYVPVLVPSKAYLVSVKAADLPYRISTAVLPHLLFDSLAFTRCSNVNITLGDSKSLLS